MKQPTVTVGICAYNEERNILSLLKSILKQNQSNFRLQHVRVFNDCSKDKTKRIVEALAKKQPAVELVNAPTNLGKMGGMNYLFKHNKSDYLVLFDADVQLVNNEVLSELVYGFTSSSETVDLVGGADGPTPSNSFIGNVAATWVDVWDTAKRSDTDYDNPYNLSARIMAVSKRFAKQIHIPSHVAVDDQFIFFLSKQLGYRFVLTTKAQALYKVPLNLKEYAIQSIRFLQFGNAIVDRFGDWVIKYYAVSRRAKIVAMIQVFVHKPLYVSCALLLQSVFRICSKFYHEDLSEGKWITVSSTK